MIDNKKIANLRLALIRANMAKRGTTCEEELAREIRPFLGELLALADAALKIRKVCKRQEAPVFADPRHEIVSTVALAMRDLDDLEGAAQRSPKSYG
jgi:hypothetical protein